ncbi:MAG TPA: hypothetical protein VFA61_01580 [Candidatus Udaeobacter sp.]|nr:hypothetical protein [Candidatus Udaeobacter sp.]
MIENCIRVLFTESVAEILIKGRWLRDASRKRATRLLSYVYYARKLVKHRRNYQQTKRKRRIHMFSRLIITAAMTVFFTAAPLILAQEHPEHPEHPQKGKSAEKQVSKEDISAGIKTNIDTQSKKSADGKFHVSHEGQDLALDLVRVHDDRLSDLGGGKYFACVDMKGTDGKTYDIDFFLTGQPGKMKVTETSVHKIDGKPLYDWKEDNGKWHKVPVS